MKRSLRHLKWCLLMVPSISAWVMPKTSAWLSSPRNVCINLHPAAMPLQLRTLRRRAGVQALEATAGHDTEARDSSDLQPHAPANRWGKSMFVDAFKQSLKLQSQFASVCAAHCLGSYVAAKAASSSLLHSLVCVCKCCSSVSGDFSHLASHRTIKTREKRNFKDLSRLVVTVSVMLTTWLIPFDVRDVFACVRVRACVSVLCMCVRGWVGWSGERMSKIKFTQPYLHVRSTLTHIYTHKQTHTHTYTVHNYTRPFTQIHIHKHTHKLTHTHTYTHTCTCTCTYTYELRWNPILSLSLTHTHTYSHIHIYSATLA